MLTFPVSIVDGEFITERPETAIPARRTNCESFVFSVTRDEGSIDGKACSLSQRIPLVFSISQYMTLEMCYLQEKLFIIYYLIKVVHAVKFVLDNMKKKTGKFDEETFREVLKWYKPIYPNVPNLRGK